MIPVSYRKSVGLEDMNIIKKNPHHWADLTMEKERTIGPQEICHKDHLVAVALKHLHIKSLVLEAQ